MFAALLVSSTVSCSVDANKTVKPEYRENPAPRLARDIEVRIEGVPGDFGYVQGAMQFDVTNRTCLPPPDANPGGHTSPVPTRTIPFALEQGDDGVWRGTVVADGMVDEDYHGRGVCHWALVNVQVQLKATGAEGETLFMADMEGDVAAAGGRAELYFPKVTYPRHPRSITDDPFVIGRPGRASVAHLGDDEVFKVTLSASEPTP
ncbi:MULTISPECIES: hypothetical protein [unclassified Luteimonas]